MASIIAAEMAESYTTSSIKSYIFSIHTVRLVSLLTLLIIVIVNFYKGHTVTAVFMLLAVMVLFVADIGYPAVQGT